MIHYHGTPITPQSERQKMAGKHFCVSFNRPDDAEWCLLNGQSVMWDNGAFTAFTKGVVPNWLAYYKWLEPRLAAPHWAVIPDVIDGTQEQQEELVKQWPHGTLGVPVWHMGLGIDYLLDLANAWPKICFGSTAAYWQVGGDRWERRADEAFNALAKRGLEPWVHMLRGLVLCGDRWPFASADSAGVARHHKRDGICPERMARRIDAVQCPLFWKTRAEQGSLI